MKTDQDTIITTIYVVIDTICKKMLSVPPQKQKMTDAEIVTIAVCSALFFNSNHEKALVWLHIGGYFPEVGNATNNMDKILWHRRESRRQNRENKP